MQQLTPVLTLRGHIPKSKEPLETCASFEQKGMLLIKVQIKV